MGAGASGNSPSSGNSGNGGGIPGAGTGGVVDPTVMPEPAFVPTPRLARLSRRQWANTVRDLLGFQDISEIERDVSGDAVVGFDNNIESLFVSETLRAELSTAAERLAARVIADPSALSRLVPADAPADAAGRGQALIRSFGRQAFRRPLSEAELATYGALFAQGPTLYPGVDAFTAGANLVIRALLESPHFLYRTELGTEAVNGKVPLDDYEVASKLSYALTDTMPDVELFAAAERGELRTKENVVAHATRLLTSERGAATRDHFHFQVFRLGAYDGIIRDKTAFPEFTTATPGAMRQEVLLFLRWIFEQNLGVKDMYTAPVTFVNAATAPLYGLTGNYDESFVKVDLDPAQRGGLLTQPGFLSQYAIVNDPDTIHRGVFVNQRVLCVTLPPPAPGAIALVEPTPEMTNRERVEATTGPGTCGAGCHSTLINPPGYAFESFDAVGKFRTTDRGKPVNTASSYDFGGGLQEFNGAIEFTKAVAESSQSHACYTQDWMTYLNGRALAVEERPLVNYLAARSVSGASVREMIMAFVSQDAFLNRLP